MFYSKLRYGALLLCLLCAARIHAQNPFSSLDFSPCTTGLFWDKINSLSDPPDGSHFDSLSYSRSASFLHKFHMASLNEQQTTLPDYPGLFTALENELLETACIPLVLADIRYNRIAQEAADNGWLTLVEGQFVQTNASQNIFTERASLILHVGAENYASHDLKFCLKSEHYYHNYPNPADEILIDFDDGLGWRTLTLDAPMNVHYASVDQQRHIRVKCLRGDFEKCGGTFMDVIVCNSDYDSPVWPTPWATVTDEYISDNHWLISTEVNGIEVAGNAYYLPTGDFDKPFIFVEGIDFVYHPQLLKNGEFGWCQFTSGICHVNYDYSMLARMPDFLDDLRAHGYDIILLDFKKGAEDIALNAKLLEHLITLVNESKTGDYPNVIAGASMGGLVSRYALREMELNGIDHCTRLWISFDAPHQGANIPLSIQQFLAGLESPESAKKIMETLLRPATRQLLKYQYFVPEGEDRFNPSMRSAFQQTLDAMGMPQNCRRIAVANGSGSGERQRNWEGEVLDDQDDIVQLWTSDVIPCNTVSELQFFIGNTAGKQSYSDDWMNVVNPNYNVSASVVQPDTPVIEYVGASAGYLSISNGLAAITGSVLGAFCIGVADPNHFYVPDNVVSWDFASGGRRRTAFDLVRELNATLIEEVPDISMADQAIPWTMVNEDHCFIPTVSALGINATNPNLNLYDAINQLETEFCFDRYSAAPDLNEQHVELTEANVQFLLEEILTCENSSGESLLTDWQNAIGTPGNTFNFGHEAYNFLPSVEIFNGSSITVNHQNPLHYGESELAGAIRQDNYKMTTAYGCEPGLIHIHHNGVLSVGDADPSFSADMRVLRDATVIISTGGVLEINPGSTLIFEEGSELVMNPGAELRIGEGSLIMKSGSRITYSGGEVYLNGDDAKIIFDGGKLFIEENAVWEPLFTTASCGEIVVWPGTENVLRMENGAIFRLKGSANDDVVLNVIDGARFENENWFVGQVELNDCRVSLHNNGEFYAHQPVISNNVNFRAYSGESGMGEVWSWSSLFSATNTSFSHVRLNTHDSKVILDKTIFEGQQSGAEIFAGFFVLDNCRFDRCGLHSEALTWMSSMANSDFTGPGNRGYRDESLVEVQIHDCLFESCYQYAIHKAGGKLSLGCSLIKDNKGLRMDDGVLNMSGLEGAGNNDFSNVQRCVELHDVQDVLLTNGGNAFTGYQYDIFEGTINQPCGNKYDCDLWIPASGNFWGFSEVMVANPAEALAYPDQDQIDVIASEIVPCAGYESTSSCEAIFYDVLPQLPPPCEGNSRKRVYIEEKEKRSDAGEILAQSNPLLYTPSFQGIALDSAMNYASGFIASEQADDIEHGISLLKEILSADIDRTFRETRDALGKARSWMKTSLEHLFAKEVLTPAANEHVFETSVQHYVDALNAMTDTVLTDSTYKDQFYLELDKVQLFRTLGRTEIAREVLAHLGDCRLDSLEQEMINKWRKQTELELSLGDQFYAQQILPDSINLGVDTSDYHQPVQYEQSNYYFGLWINGPQDYVFVSCGAQPVYRSEDLTSSLDWTVFPNPANEAVNITGLEKGYHEVRIYDVQGRLVEASKVFSDGESSIVVIATHSLASGLYAMEIQQGMERKRRMLEVQH